MKKFASFSIILALTLSPALGQDYPTGLIYDEAAAEAVPATPQLLTRSYESLPASASIKKYAPRPGYQRLPSCTGWATAYAGRSISKAIAENNTDLTRITAEAFSPGFVYNQVKISRDCSNGASISSALAILKQQGCPKHKTYPEQCNVPISMNVKTEAAKYKIADYRRISRRGGNRIKGIKKALAENNPVVFGMVTYNSFTSGSGEVWNGLKDSQRGSHAMTIISYDDNKYGGAFEVMNSWSQNWRNNGFIWIRYNDLESALHSAFEIIESLDPQPKPQPKPEPKPVIYTFDANLNFQLVDGGNMAIEGKTDITRGQKRESKRSILIYRSIQAYTSGTEYRVFIDNQKAAYLYIFASDLTGEVNPIFPEEKESALLPYTSNQIALPSEDDFIELDETVGKDYVCFIFSKKGLDLNDILRRVKAESGTIPEKLLKALDKAIIPDKYIDYERARMAFKVQENQSGYLIPVVVEMDHQ